MKGERGDGGDGCAGWNGFEGSEESGGDGVNVMEAEGKDAKVMKEEPERMRQVVQ